MYVRPYVLRLLVRYRRCTRYVWCTFRCGCLGQLCDWYAPTPLLVIVCPGEREEGNELMALVLGTRLVVVRVVRCGEARGKTLACLEHRTSFRRCTYVPSNSRLRYCGFAILVLNFQHPRVL